MDTNNSLKSRGNGGEIPAPIDDIAASVLLVDLRSGRILYANQDACTNLEKKCHDVVDHLYQDVFPSQLVLAYESLIPKEVDEKIHTIVYYHPGKTVWRQLVLRLVKKNGADCTLLTITDISQFVFSQYASENAACFDSQLWLPNGRKLEADINELINVDTVDLIYFRLESLPEIRGMYGWESGDILLQEIRDWLLASGAEEPEQIYHLENGFAVLGRGVTKEDGERRAHTILNRFNQPWVLPICGQKMQVYCAIKLGIVRGQYVKNDMRNLLLRTIESAPQDQRYVVYDAQTNKKANDELRIRDTLINCIYSGMKGFEVYYQPIVEASTRRWIAVEALCRWFPSPGEQVPPDIFIHDAERLGLIGMVDSWVRKTAMERCVELGLDKKTFFLDVNFSPRQQFNRPFLRDLKNSIMETGFPVDKLNIEITESSHLVQDENILHHLKNITGHGIKLSLDDFGTGYSSLEYLIRINANFLKIEKLFLDDIATDKYKQYLLQMLKGLANYLGMRIIAEGIETEMQLQILRRLDIGFAQGYLFSKPIPYEILKREIDHFTIS